MTHSIKYFTLAFLLVGLAMPNIVASDTDEKRDDEAVPAAAAAAAAPAPEFEVTTDAAETRSLQTVMTEHGCPDQLSSYTEEQQAAFHAAWKAMCEGSWSDEEGQKQLATALAAVNWEDKETTLDAVIAKMKTAVEKEDADVDLTASVAGINLNGSESGDTEEDDGNASQEENTNVDNFDDDDSEEDEAADSAAVNEESDGASHESENDADVDEE